MWLNQLKTLQRQQRQTLTLVATTWEQQQTNRFTVRNGCGLLTNVCFVEEPLLICALTVARAGTALEIVKSNIG
jgi:hypothetical protein